MHPFFKAAEDQNLSQSGIDRLKRTNVGMSTNGVSIAENFEHGTETIELGTFDEGWITQPAIGNDCPNCPDNMPTYVHGHPDRDILLLECGGCLTRYDGKELGGR